MYKNVLRAIEGVELFPVMSFLIFIFFFLAVLYVAFTMKKSDVQHMSNLPLDTEQEPETNLQA